MKLQYRGISYESNPHPMTSVTSEITAKFRGFIYHIQQPLKTYLHSVHILKYRGVNYIKGNQKISGLDSQVHQQKDINSALNHYYISEEAQRFLRDFNKFNL
ncbi:DUF4278 domain-containing protein [Calothrix rhizosoleniae]|uniref:DUF4278 domain-containing protein n=1 Tax=Calothrix rhizosoleniae TaxID=888997 RepID=UPI000B4A0BA1|nr:DUF4278 domain-containing protein [Calothrix rhizosoleniae]MCJ8278556.1 DUF4278 domain-containing protein [Rivularia sp. ALOHA_DT_140]